MKTALSVSMLLIAVLLVVGCVPSRHKTQPSAGIEQFGDIPVPAGFKLLDSSYSREADVVRTASLRYEGKRNVEGVDKFYKQVMPQLGWNLYQTEPAPGIEGRYLYFRKDTTVCVVYLCKISRSTSIGIEIR